MACAGGPAGIASGNVSSALRHAALLSSDLNDAPGSVSAFSDLGQDLRILPLTAPVRSGNGGGVVGAKLDALTVAQAGGEMGSGSV